VRRFTPLALVLCAIAPPGAPAAPAGGRLPSDVEIVRDATDALRASPGDPIPLWQRAEAFRRLGQSERALADCEAVIERHPGSPYAVRAKRALPILLARLGRAREAVEADERLLEERLVDPVVTLPRLAIGYARIGEPKAALEAAARLRAIDPARADANPDVRWIEADAIDRLKRRSEAAPVMLAFAQAFPDDRRRGEAMVRAARAEADLGRVERALEIARQALDGPLPPAAAEGARVARAELFERLGRTREATGDLLAAIETSRDPALIEIAVGRYADLEQERHGTEAAIVRLAELAASRRPAVADAARRRLPALLDGLAARRTIEPERAAFVVRLVERTDPAIEPPAALRIAAARLWESVGTPAPGEGRPDPASLALARGDELALAGDWGSACRAFDAARGAPLVPLQAAWLELRLSECELRRGETGAARRRLAGLLAAEPEEPVATAARRLAARAPGLALTDDGKASTR